MATNVTTDTLEFIIMNLVDKETDKYECKKRITEYNTIKLPEKNAHYKEDLERRKEKRAARPEKYAGKAPLPDTARVLKPIDLDTNPEYLGLLKAVEAYKYARYCVNYMYYIDKLFKIPENRLFSEEDYIDYFEKLLKTEEIRLACATKRLARNREKLAANKLKNPKKYGKRPDLPEVNREMINNQRKITHYKTIIDAIRDYSIRGTREITVDIPSSATRRH